MTYQFDVIGKPVSQGSKRAFVLGGKARIVEAGGARHALFRSQVCEAARVAKGTQPTLDGPLSVHLTFWMPCVKSDPHRSWHMTAPDIDKMVRLILDSLTNSAIIRDDSLVCQLYVEKHYARDGHWTGVSIEITDFSDIENELREQSKAQAKAARRALNARRTDVGRTD